MMTITLIKTEQNTYKPFDCCDLFVHICGEANELYENRLDWFKRMSRVHGVGYVKVITPKQAQKQFFLNKEMPAYR